MAKLNLSGKQKAAVLINAIGPERATEILGLLPEKIIEEIVPELTNVNSLKREVFNEVIKEAYTRLEDEAIAFIGAGKEVQDLLLKSLGQAKGKELLRKIRVDTEQTHFGFLRNAELYSLVEILKREHPQTIALIMAHSPSDLVGQILEMFSDELRVNVVSRVASIDRASIEVINGLKEVLKGKLTSIPGGIQTGGPKVAAEFLTQVNREIEKRTLDVLEANEPDIATKIKRYMLLFESLALLSDKDLQRVFMEVDVKDLVLALKGASKQISEKIINNLPKSRREIVEEELSIMGAVRMVKVDEAQQKILNRVTMLEEKGEIVLIREGETIV